MRAFLVRLPSGARYWTVLDEDLQVVQVADGFLRQVRFGRDGAESTTKSYACSVWGCSWCGWRMRARGSPAAAIRGRFCRARAARRRGARGAGRINTVLTAVRGMVVHAVAAGEASGHLVPLLYEIADDRDLPGQARGEDGQMSWRMRALHRACEVERPVGRAADADIAAVVTACRSARDRLVVLLMARAGLRRGEVAGLRRSDVHLLADSRPLGCGTARAHVHVVRREDNPNGAWAKSRRQRVVPLDFLTVQAFDTYEFERMAVPAAGGSDFVLVNLFRPPVGAPMRLDAINDLVAAASRRAGIAPVLRPHQLRHAFGSNVADAGAGIDVIADLLGHVSAASSQVYLHPDPARLREAVEKVPSPRAGTAAPW
jgi:integrase/recombinase XerD